MGMVYYAAMRRRLEGGEGEEEVCDGMGRRHLAERGWEDGGACAKLSERADGAGRGNTAAPSGAWAERMVLDKGESVKGREREE